MTIVKFLSDGAETIGFSLEGHSSCDCDDEEGKIVCSAVSSAVFMAANTITEIVGDDCDIDVSDAKFYLKDKTVSSAGSVILKGLKLHLTELSSQYPNKIKILTEV